MTIAGPSQSVGIVETDLYGPGTTQALYGSTNVGLITGAAYAALGATARLEMLVPPARRDSASLVAASVRAEVAGGLAEAYAGGPGSSTHGYARAQTGHDAQLRTTSQGAFVSGSVQAEGYGASLEATAQGAHALGYARSYPGAPYGVARITATQRGALASGAVLYSGEINCDAIGGLALGSARGGYASGQPGTIESLTNGSVALGHTRGGLISAAGLGGKAGGNAFHVQTANLGSRPTIRTSGPAGHGSIAWGEAVNGGALIDVQGEGSFALGVANVSAEGGVAELVVGPVGVANGALAGGAADAGGPYVARVAARENGALAWGVAITTTVTTQIEATAEGSFAQGRAANSPGLLASNRGAFAQGSADGGGQIAATARGAFAQGQTTVAAYGITASGAGSFAQGHANTAAIAATARNAAQFGPGTNSVEGTLRVGSAGLHLKGTPGAFGALANGQFWVAGGNVYVRSGGVTKNLTTV